jgi:BlaI family transcriptional regulator, penicillinase repressor
MVRKRTSNPLTPLELEIMKVLWDTAPATVRSVRERLPASPKLAYTTVQTMLNILLRKGNVKRRLKGKSYEYEPRLSRKAAAGAALEDMLERVFGGSVDSLLVSLAESRHLNYNVHD